MWGARSDKERRTDTTTHNTRQRRDTQLLRAFVSFLSSQKSKICIILCFLYLSSKEKKGQTEGKRGRTEGLAERVSKHSVGERDSERLSGKSVVVFMPDDCLVHKSWCGVCLCVYGVCNKVERVLFL